MKKIGTLTFHSSYNFGSNLQAYALQEYIKKISNECNVKIDYSIINLRTKIQKELYDYKKNHNFFKKIIKYIFFGRTLSKRQKKFEKFINDYMNITKEYSNRDDIINDNILYDICITGSDQIWNLSAYDFDWSYLLDGIRCKKRISYAVSSGPKKNNLLKKDRDRMKSLINAYDSISVREEGTKQFINEMSNKRIEINMDPTILLNRFEWDKIISNEKIVDTPYIFYYSLKPSFSRTKFLKELSKKMNMKVVVAYPSYKFEIASGFIKKYDSGPLDFLNLLKNAKLVVSSSFHGTIFSIIFNVPFFALNGKNDYRISTLLKTMRLENRMISEEDDLNELKDVAFKIDFSEANKAIDYERKKSKKYLINALGLGDN